jgi:hypothetical protein
VYLDRVQQAVQLAAGGEQPAGGIAAAVGGGEQGNEVPLSSDFRVEAQLEHDEEQPLPRQDIRDESFEVKGDVQGMRVNDYIAILAATSIYLNPKNVHHLIHHRQTHLQSHPPRRYQHWQDQHHIKIRQ